MADPFDLARFVAAQDPLLDQVRRELAAGDKRSHWMWFIFPQLRALGQSPTALRYGIAGLEEAGAYWAHPLLGPRLLDCTRLVLGVQGRSLVQIFGQVDALKFRSCITLFEAAAPAEPAFPEALARYCGGERDPRTLALLAG